MNFAKLLLTKNLMNQLPINLELQQLYGIAAEVYAVNPKQEIADVMQICLSAKELADKGGIDATAGVLDYVKTKLSPFLP